MDRWESLIERQIREATEQGDFDGLPHVGERIPVEDDGSEWALAHHVLKQAGGAPEWVATDRAYREALARRDVLLARAARRGPPARDADRAELRRLVAEADGLAVRLEHIAPTPKQHRPRLDAARELAALEAAVAEGPEPPR